MKLRTNIFDLWAFHRQKGIPDYILFHTSKEKADRWFHEGCFWQIPGGFTEGDEDISNAISRVMDEIKLKPLACWAAEHVYTYYNPLKQTVFIILIGEASIVAMITRSI